MNAAEILYEAYDLLPVPDEREFLKLVLDRVNPGLLTGLITDMFSIGGQQELGAALMCCDVKEWQELEAIRDVRQERANKKRILRERAERIRANAVKIKPADDPRNPYTNEKSFPAFINARLGDNWYIASRPLKKYQGTDKVNISQARYNKLYAEWEQTK